MTESQLVSQISGFAEELLGDLKPQVSLACAVVQRRGPCKVRVLYSAGALGAAVEQKVKDQRLFRETWQRCFPVNRMVLCDPDLIKIADAGEVSLELWLFSEEVTDG